MPFYTRSSTPESIWVDISHEVHQTEQEDEIFINTLKNISTKNINISKKFELNIVDLIQGIKILQENNLTCNKIILSSNAFEKNIKNINSHTMFNGINFYINNEIEDNTVFFLPEFIGVIVKQNNKTGISILEEDSIAIIRCKKTKKEILQDVESDFFNFIEM